MGKVGSILLIIAFVVLSYIFIMAFQPVTNSIVESANTTIAANSDNWTNYRETQAVLVGWPFWQWFLPVTIGGVVVVITLVRK